MAGLVGLVLGLGLAIQARAAGPFEKNFWLSGPRYDAVVPLCDYSWALWKIKSHFAEKEREFWHSKLSIAGFDHVREVAFRPWPEGTIPRRFCRAVALVSDGVKRDVFYSIGEDTGWLGNSYGVEWCVVGLDRNWAYAPHCRMAQP